MYLRFFLAIRYYLRCLGDMLKIDNRRGRPFSQGRTYMHSVLLPLIHYYVYYLDSQLITLSIDINVMDIILWSILWLRGKLKNLDFYKKNH